MGRLKRKPPGHSDARVHRVIKFMREERVWQKLTQEELGLRANISRSAVGNYERGENAIAPLFTIERMLNSLGYRLIVVRDKR